MLLLGDEVRFYWRTRTPSGCRVRVRCEGVVVGIHDDYAKIRRTDDNMFGDGTIYEVDREFIVGEL